MTLLHKRGGGNRREPIPQTSQIMLQIDEVLFKFICKQNSTRCYYTTHAANIPCTIFANPTQCQIEIISLVHYILEKLLQHMLVQMYANKNTIFLEFTLGCKIVSLILVTRQLRIQHLQNKKPCRCGK